MDCLTICLPPFSYCHFVEDTQGDDMTLCYLRDKNKREVDFVVLKSRKPLFAVESKTGETDLSRHISYFASRTEEGKPE